MTAPGWNEHYVEMLAALTRANAEYLIVGAFAMAAHGVPRATVDLDIFVRPSAANASRVYEALSDFGAPLEAHGLTEADLSTEGTVYQIGLPPQRIDVITAITGVGFDAALEDHIVASVGDLRVPVIGRDALIRNKRATGRSKDLVDVELLTTP